MIFIRVDEGEIFLLIKGSHERAALRRPLHCRYCGVVEQYLHEFVEIPALLGGYTHAWQTLGFHVRLCILDPLLHHAVFGYEIALREGNDNASRWQLCAPAVRGLRDEAPRPLGQAEPVVQVMLPVGHLAVDNNARHVVTLEALYGEWLELLLPGSIVDAKVRLSVLELDVFPGQCAARATFFRTEFLELGARLFGVDAVDAYVVHVNAVRLPPGGRVLLFEGVFFTILTLRGRIAREKHLDECCLSITPRSHKTHSKDRVVFEAGHCW